MTVPTTDNPCSAPGHFLNNAYRSEKHQFLYIATPKVACTSLKWWFADLIGKTTLLKQFKEGTESSKELDIHQGLATIAPEAARLSINTILETFESKNYYCFALVRNPFHRIFSAWQSKILLREPLQFSQYCGFNFANGKIRTSADIAFMFQEFLEHIQANESNAYIDPHWTPQWNLLRPDLYSYSLISKIEETTHLQLILSNRIGSEFKNPFSGHANKANESLLPFHPIFITTRSQQLIHELYTEDFEGFGYERGIPTNPTTLDELDIGSIIKSIKGIQIRNEKIGMMIGEISKHRQEAEFARAESKELESLLTISKRQIAELTIRTSSQDRLIEALLSNTNALQADLKNIKLSASWQITSPLRKSVDMYDTFKLGVVSKVRYAHDAFWRRMPLGNSHRELIKDFIFKNFPSLFAKSVTFKNWQANLVKSRGEYQNQSYSFSENEYKHPDVTFVEFSGKPIPQANPVKVICFYLPQFHCIPENDQWWGAGFTEWTNVRPAKPIFFGHNQPKLPGDLGYYDLSTPDIQRKQVELAKIYGIDGFCFYFYWFGGKRLLETPIENYLNNSELDRRFCLCWANENWSRRWDGLESEILIKQNYSPEDDIEFIQYISKYLKDARYITVQNKPLLIVYRPSLLPNPIATATRWRNWCRSNGIGEIYLAYTQSFEVSNPSIYGFDAAIEFPPNNSAPPDITKLISDKDVNFTGTIYDWRIFAERSKKYKKESYHLFRCVNPGWDNTARRKNKATIFLGNTPELYKKWLKNAIMQTVSTTASPADRLVFVNAWNEWAEGAYLEPDGKYGYAYLEATREALLSTTKHLSNNSILLICHDFHPHGAQYLLLAIAKQFIKFNLNVCILALKGGPLQKEFEELCEVHVLGDSTFSTASNLFNELRAKSINTAIANTVVSGSVIPGLKSAGFSVLSLVHELPGVIEEFNQEDNARLLSEHSDLIVFPSELVYHRFLKFSQPAQDKVKIRHQGVLRKNPYVKADARQITSKLHKLDEKCKIVLAVGYLDSRKAPDLFIHVAAKVCKKINNCVFIWVGHAEQGIMPRLEQQALSLEIKDKVIFTGFIPDPLTYYAAASVFALTSREDPFPNVVLESIEAKVPVVAFEGATGAGELIKSSGGLLAKYLDIDDYASKVIQLLETPFDRSFNYDMSFRKYSIDLLHLIHKHQRISVIIPNFNYGQYIEKRLFSICNQTYPIYEVIVFDDASTDDSCVRIQNFINSSDVDIRLVRNTSNSGSPFKQWMTGVQMCTGDLVWIAEADDLSMPEFVENVASAFEDIDVVLSYCQSKQIDSNDIEIAQNYLEYTADISDLHNNNYQRAGIDEIRDFLTIKNTIPNISGVIFRRAPLLSVLNENFEKLCKFNVGGDWFIYLMILKMGKIQYTKESLNLHRRHAQSVTHSFDREALIHEISELQEIAHSLSNPDPQTTRKAVKYVEHLRAHWGII